ncbi:hypothetical protein BDK51DRAFT_42868 [Blyttiomyces helicus]|uniref:TauD/TfdA-like domain-containing protein n=3 Tax=Fungi incertae sedis TaxID=112252 RepID=A0A4P9ZJM9_9FUNG|nr:hypothetical protein BDK51DRAFT_42868 [Blyttiomyces helicus]RKP24132.1 hypothetical protein SYNPS1DRAFT_17605 [Syncephalis pseudoplumigaleata]RKP33427.1 hypothetical protein BJ085DRAFT_22899 [Dimargaris cristalligena]|eukprot:RKO93366.1 hypothetical protein BDK51DRAFT_42868 [Blyttiomyces helicus]
MAPIATPIVEPLPISPPFEEWPEKITGPTVWDAKFMQAHPEEWIHHLTPAEIEDIDQALRSFESTGIPLDKISPESFPLPVLGPYLAKNYETLVAGRGFSVIRGVPIERYSREEAVKIFMGIMSHNGPFVTQNAWGHILGHVKDHGNDASNPNVRLYTTNALNDYHTDSCDIVSLFCWRTAVSGGGSFLASTHAIYNDLQKNDPAALRELCRSDIYWDRKVDVPEGKKAYYQSPVFNNYKGRILGIFDRDYMINVARHAEVPTLSDERIRAYDAVIEAAKRNSIQMQLQRGDIQFVHNHQNLHARSGYVDSKTDPNFQRHLFRLWVSTGGRSGWPLPAPFGNRFAGDLSGKGKRGGLHPNIKETVVLDSVDVMH